MHTLTYLLLLATASLTVISLASAIQCFNCNPCRAGNGTLETCPENVSKSLNPKRPPMDERFCLKAVIASRTAVARGCGHTTAQFYGLKMMQGCHTRTVDGVSATYCRCDEDFCNAAPAWRNSVGAVATVMLVMVLR